jgi:hypothetical protein
MFNQEYPKNLRIAGDFMVPVVRRAKPHMGREQVFRISLV